MAQRSVITELFTTILGNLICWQVIPLFIARFNSGYQSAMAKFCLRGNTIKHYAKSFVAIVPESLNRIILDSSDALK